MNYYKIKNQNTTSIKKTQHWSYAAMWFIILAIPFLMVLFWGFLVYWCAAWIILLLF